MLSKSEAVLNPPALRLKLVAHQPCLGLFLLQDCVDESRLLFPRFASVPPLQGRLVHLAIFEHLGPLHPLALVSQQVLVRPWFNVFRCFTLRPHPPRTFSLFLCFSTPEV